MRDTSRYLLTTVATALTAALAKARNIDEVKAAAIIDTLIVKKVKKDG